MVQRGKGTRAATPPDAAAFVRALYARFPPAGQSLS